MEILIILLLVAVLGFQVYLFWSKKDAPATQDTQGLMMLQNQMQNLERAVEEKLSQGTEQMFQSIKTQFGESQRLATDIRDTVHKQLREVAEGVAKTQESTKQVFTIAEQLQNLEKVLTNQKQRGNLGEASLQLILDNVLGASGTYQMQYEFPGGETVDAAIFTKEGIIPIDAKFSLDNYNRLIHVVDNAQRAELERAFKNDLKLRIDETSKYIRPKDGTLPFAFMYIPAEGIYYDLLVNEVGAAKVNTRNLIDYANNEKKVIIVSPTTFTAYLQSVLYGFKALKIEEAAKDIMKNVENLSRHMKAYEDFYKRLGTSLSTTVGHFNSGYRELGKIDKDVLKITGKSVGVETIAIDKPQLEGREE